MRVLRVCAAVLLLAVVAVPVMAGEPAASSNFEVVVVLRDGKTTEGTLLEGSKEGALKIKSPYGEQTLVRTDWIEVRPKRRPAEFNIADGLMRDKSYDRAAKKYQEIYDTYANLYIFGGDALDGKGLALLQGGKNREAMAVYEQLFREYSGADLTWERRYRYAVALFSAGGKANFEQAISQLNGIIAGTDDLLTARALNLLGKTYYAQEQYMSALRAYLQIYVLYSTFTGDGAREAQSLAARAKENVLACCDKLATSSDSAIRKRAEKIRERLAGSR